MEFRVAGDLPRYPAPDKGPKEYDWRIVSGEFIRDTGSPNSLQPNSAEPKPSIHNAADTFDRDRKRSASSKRDKYLSLAELIREFITDSSKSTGIGISFDRFEDTPHFTLAVQSRQDNRPSVRNASVSTGYTHQFAFIIGPGAGDQSVISIYGLSIFNPSVLLDDNKFEQEKRNSEPRLLADIVISPGQSPRRPVETFVAEIFSMFRKYPQKLENSFRISAETINQKLALMCSVRPAVVRNDPIMIKQTL